MTTISTTPPTILPTAPFLLTAGTKTKTIFWKTNYNNKMACAAFVHIDLAPKQRPLRKTLEETSIEIYTEDNSHPPVKALLYDLLFMPFEQVSDYLAFASNGMTAMELANFMFETHHPNFSWKTEVTVYFYRKYSPSS